MANSNTRLKVAAWHPYSFNFGPGQRSVVVLQGAMGKSYRPVPEYSASAGGMDVPLGEVLSWLDLNSAQTDGSLTVAGGEPLDQMEALIELCQQVRIRRPDAHIVVYTAWSWSKVKKDAKELLKLINAVACGPFDPDTICVTSWGCMYSENQQWVKLGGAKPEIIEAVKANGRPGDLEKKHLV